MNVAGRLANTFLETAITSPQVHAQLVEVLKFDLIGQDNAHAFARGLRGSLMKPLPSATLLTTSRYRPDGKGF